MLLNNIKIKNFKSLKNIDIALSNLTLIAGVNSSGKSSFIQTFLLMKENINFYFMPTSKKYTCITDGEYIKLGGNKSLLHEEALGEKIIFEFGYSNTYSGIKLDAKFNMESFDDEVRDENNNDHLMELFDDDFYYLNTDRVAPALTFPFSETYIEKGLLGINGQYTAHYLAENRHQKLAINDLQHADSQTNQLLENTYKWLGEISSGVFISASADASTQSVKLIYQYEYGNNTSSHYSPLNVGFGLTYVLPVIVSILKSKPGDFLIIENPESHLHPAGQSKIAELCAIASNHGVQIIAETHSDHFLNGLRVATKNKIIAPEKSRIYFFKKEKDSLDTVAQPINIDKDGKIDDWPNGFFDEWDKQLDKLLW